MHQQRNSRYGAIVAALAIGALACNDPTNATKALTTQAASSLAADKGGNSSGPTGVVPPTGSPFALSINAVPQGDVVTMTGTDGRTIFVQLFGGDSASSLKGGTQSSINQQDRVFIQAAPTGQTYQVLRVNGTDVNGASIQLPVVASGSYAVWAQMIAPPAGAVPPSCTTISGGVSCFVGTISIPRSPNANVQNRSSDLLAIKLDASANPTLATCLGVSGHQTATVGLFNSCFQGIFWSTQANGTAQVQLQLFPKS